MNASPSSSGSQGVLIALVAVSLIASLGTMGLLVRQQNQSANAQRELLTTLAALRSAPAPSTATANVQPSQVAAPANEKPPVTNSVGQVAPPSQKDDWLTATYDGVSISYPKTLSATNNEDVLAYYGQNDLRISSSPDRKHGIDFRDLKGYDLIMRKVDDQLYANNRKESTVNPLVSSIVEMCDGEACPDAQYIFIKNGKRYLIEVRYRMTPYQAGVDLNDRVIASIK